MWWWGPSVRQNIPRILCISKLYRSVHSTRPLVPILNLEDQVHVIWYYFHKIHFNNILSVNKLRIYNIKLQKPFWVFNLTFVTLPILPGIMLFDPAIYNKHLNGSLFLTRCMGLIQQPYTLRRAGFLIKYFLYTRFNILEIRRK